MGIKIDEILHEIANIKQLIVCLDGLGECDKRPCKVKDKIIRRLEDVIDKLIIDFLNKEA